MEIRSYRAVFDLERRIYRVNRLRLNPGGIPLRGVVYCFALLAGLALLGALPLVGVAVRALPWYLRDLVLPGGGAALLTVIRVEGRPFHLAATALLRHALGSRELASSCVLGGSRCHARFQRAWYPESLLVLPDGSDAHLRRLRFTGPGAVLVRVAHTRSAQRRGLLGRLGGALSLRRPPHVTLRELPGHQRPPGGQAIALERGARLEVRLVGDTLVAADVVVVGVLGVALTSTSRIPSLEAMTRKKTMDPFLDQAGSKMRMIGKIVGLCFVSVFVVSMVAAGTASAAPYWLVCLPATSGSTATKYSEHQCVKAEAGGGWEWSELENTELPVKARSTLTLEDEVVAGTTAAVACSGVEEGTIGPGRTGTITGISEIKCEKGENCSTLEKNAEPVNLPWATELYETEGTIRIALLNSSEGAPGWKVECSIGGIKEKDECTSEGANAAAENKTTPGLLVSVAFPKPNDPKATCTLTKKETGDVLGSSAISLVNGEGLRAPNKKIGTPGCVPGRGAGSPRSALPVLPARAAPARVAQLGPGTPRTHRLFC